jgi:hypothetical protein
MVASFINSLEEITMTKKFAATYEIDYTHRVVVGVTAPDAETAKQLASNAFDEGTIWNDTEDMPLLFDDYEEVNDETLLFSAEEISEFPEPDSSVKAIKQKEFAFYVCQALLAGCCNSARDFARKALPHVAAELSSQQDDAQATLLDDSLLTSTEALDLARDHNIELSLSLKSGLRATHFLCSEPDGQYFHKDIDGVIREIYPEDFLDTYPDSLGKIWRIDQGLN